MLLSNIAEILGEQFCASVVSKRVRPKCGPYGLPVSSPLHRSKFACGRARDPINLLSDSRDLGTLHVHVHVLVRSRFDLDRHAEGPWPTSRLLVLRHQD